MKVYHFEREQLVKQPLQEVFSFFERPENLQALMPSTAGFQMLTPRPLHLSTGAVYDYIAKIRGFPVRWTSLITECEPPERFVDVQLRGPFAFWHHTHRFTETAEGTWVHDDVHYAMPFGPLGRLAHWLFVRRDLNYIFDYRSQVIEQMFVECKRRGAYLSPAPRGTV